MKGQVPFMVTFVVASVTVAVLSLAAGIGWTRLLGVSPDLQEPIVTLLTIAAVSVPLVTALYTARPHDFGRRTREHLAIAWIVLALCIILQYPAVVEFLQKLQNMR